MAYFLQWLIISLLVLIPYWKILSRTGCSKSMIILIFIPVIGIFIYWLVLVTSDWPRFQYASRTPEA